MCFLFSLLTMKALQREPVHIYLRNYMNMTVLQEERGEKAKLSRKYEDHTRRPNETGNTKQKAFRDHLNPVLWFYGPDLQISDRCLLQLSSHCLQLSLHEHISFKLVGTIKVWSWRQKMILLN